MDHNSLQTELQNRINAFNEKWQSRCQAEYNGDFEQLYNTEMSDILSDTRPIWEICYQMDLMKDYAENDKE